MTMRNAPTIVSHVAPWRRSTRVRLLVMPLLVALTSCTQPADLPLTPPAIAADVVRDTPAAAARSVVVLLRAQLAAVAQHDTAAAEAARDQIVWHLVDRGLVRPGSDATPNMSTSTAKILVNLVDSWAAILNYYADGLLLDELTVQASRTADRALVTIPARTADNEGLLRIACAADANGQWRVFAFGFAGRVEETAASAPTTQP